MLEQNVQYICFEKLNYTAQFTQLMEEWNQSSHTCIGPVSSRIVGFIGTPFVSLTEALAHGGLAAGKALTGLIVSPYNCIADSCFPDYSLPHNLELSSALVHVILSIESILTAVLLPFVCLLNPSRANALMNTTIEKPQIQQPQEDFKALRENAKGKIERMKVRHEEKIAEKELELETAINELNEYKLEVKGKRERMKKRNAERIERREDQIKALEAEKANAIENASKSDPAVENLRLQLECIKKLEDSENKHAGIINKLEEENRKKIQELESQRDQLAEELEGAKADLFGVEEDKVAFRETYSDQKEQIQALTEEKEDLIEQLRLARIENQASVVAKEHYDIHHLVDSTDLSSKHRDILQDKSGIYLKHITLPKVQEIINKIESLTNFVTENPDTRFKFIMNGDDWEGDVELESDHSDDSTIHIDLNKSTLDLGGSTFLTDSVILGQRSPDADTLSHLSDYFHKFEASLSNAIMTKGNAPTNLEDKLILARAAMV